MERHSPLPRPGPPPFGPSRREPCCHTLRQSRTHDQRRVSAMSADDKVVINLATGLEDAERVTVAFLVATAAVARRKKVVMFLTKEGVRLGLPGGAEGVACDGCPPLPTLFEQYAEGGGELLVCPICFAPASSTRTASSRMRGSAARRRSGNGSTTGRPSSATERRGRSSAAATARRRRRARSRVRAGAWCAGARRRRGATRASSAHASP